MDKDKLVERFRRWFERSFLSPRVKLVHGQYPMSGRPKSEMHWSVGNARRAVKHIYRDEIGWWFQILRDGREVWSSDHELAAALRSHAQPK